MSGSVETAGLLVVMSAPSGAGKGTLRRALVADHEEVVFCPSVTTRRPRPGEVCGEDYHFVNEDEFGQMIRDGEFAEWANVYGNLYGTPRRSLGALLARGLTVLIEKDVQGAASLRAVYPDAAYVFVLPPSFEELKRRVEGRGTESACDMNRRLSSYREELRHLEQYDYVIVNDDLARALRVLEAIIVAERSRVKRCLGVLGDRNEGG